jgi:hypothetical protein
VKTIFSKHVFFLLSLATFTVVGSGLSAQAETMDTGSTDAEALLSVSAPVPATTATSATALTPESPVTPQQAEKSAQTVAPSVAQIDIDPDVPIIGGTSYIGIAGNIGLDGDTSLGEGSFMVISKVGLTNNISVRPSAVLGNDTIFLVPLTFDVSILPVDAFERALPLSPYVGGGVAIATGDDDDVGPLVTAGVDFGLTPQFTATAAVNVGFLDDTDIGLLIGVGYNFLGF